MNRHVVGNERVLQERRKRLHLGLESCGEHREVVPLVNHEVIEMMRVAHVPQSASSDPGVPLTRARCGVIGPEKPRRSAAGKRCTPSSDRSSATLGEETPIIKQR